LEKKSYGQGVIVETGSGDEAWNKPNNNNNNNNNSKQIDIICILMGWCFNFFSGFSFGFKMVYTGF